MIQQPKHTLTDEAVQRLKETFPESNSPTTRVVWWDGGGYLEEIVEDATAEMDIDFRAAESFPLELRHGAVSEERQMDRPMVWYVGEEKAGRDWFRDIRETGGEVTCTIEELTADLYDVNAWDIFDVERHDEETREDVADLIKQQFQGPGTPQYDKLKEEIITRGGGQLLDHLLRDGWPEISRDPETVANVRSRLGDDIPIPDDASPKEITETVRRWAVAQSLHASGVDAAAFPTGYGESTHSPLTDLLEMGGTRARAEEYLGESYWPDVIDELDDVWAYADCPVDLALETALWEAWHEQFQNGEFAACIEHAADRQAALEVYPESTGWHNLWAQCEHFARLESYFDAWESTDHQRDPFARYADQENGTWKIDNEVLQLQLTGSPETTIPSAHPATAVVPEIRDTMLTTRYRNYLETLAEAVEASMQTGSPLVDKQQAHQWWDDHDDDFEKTGTVAVFLIDALRFDLAQQLADELAESFDVTQETRMSTLPSETKFGMAGLTPGRAHRFSVNMHNGSLSASKGGESLSTKGQRKEYLSGEGWATPDDRDSGWGPQQIAYYDKEIDEVGEGEIGNIEAHLDSYVSDLAAMIQDMLTNEKWDKIYVATDHGFVLLPEGTTTESVPSDATNAEVKYRRVAGDDLNPLENGVHIPSNTAGLDYLDTNLQLLVNPRQYFSKQGYGGDRYYHGGLLPQECMLSFLEIQK